MADQLAPLPQGYFGSDYPPINLPTMDQPTPAREPLRVIVRPPARPAAAPATQAQPSAQEDPYGGFSAAPPAATTPGLAEDPYASFSDKPSPPPEKSDKTFGGIGGEIESGVRGGLDAATFGLAPAIEGVGAAAGPEYQQTQFWHDIAPVVGAAKLLHNYFSDHPDPEVQQNYIRGRQKAELDEQAAEEQNPKSYLAGQLIGSLLTPGFGAAKGAGMLGRVGMGALAGGIGGGLYGTGSAISKGQSPEDIAKSAAGGAAVGTAFGGGAAGVLGLGGKALSKGVSLLRGHTDTDAEAARRIVQGGLQPDYERAGLPLTPEEIQVANRAGVPRANIDVGGERTRALARSAANTSPEARSALKEMTDARLAGQKGRIAGFIKAITGGHDAGADTEVLKQAARVANAPRYQRAYAAGDRPIWSNELQRLADTSPTVKQAMRDAEGKWGDWQALDKFGASKPSVRMGSGGTLAFTNARGIPTYPNMQYWDYVARELGEKAERARSRGTDQEAARFGGLETMVKDELDRLVPEYKDARGTAASFFGAKDALDAGQKFTEANFKINDARRALAQMTPAERELFARGFASDLADKVTRTGTEAQSVLNSVFLQSTDAKDRIALALGPDRARQIEMLLRVENHADLARRMLQGSDTAQKLMEMGLAGGGVAAFEGFKEHDFNLAHVLTGALLLGGVKHGAKVIDAKVARRVGEMLASNDPTIYRRGLQVVAKSDIYSGALRRSLSQMARVAGHDIGPAKTAAGAAVLIDKALRGTPAEEPSKTDYFDDQANQ